MIAVAFSGGIDSLMALHILQQQGHQVFALYGLFLEQHSDFLQHLQTTCDLLKVPLHIVDMRHEFRELIIKPFLQNYLSGLTPNPCVHCNREIKCKLLLSHAQKLGAEKMATGHYARLLSTPHGIGIFQGADEKKDQSYFLSLINRDTLPQLIFPLGEWTKNEIVTKAKKLNISPFTPKESQEICFIPDNYRDFLQRETGITPQKGKIITTDGTILGEHQGLWQYTIGQRKGLGIAYAFPLYVTGKDFADNTLLVGSKKELLATTCEVKQINVLQPFNEQKEIFVKTKYRHQAERITMRQNGTNAILHFTNPTECPTAGQIAAFYTASGLLLGGGIIA